MYEIKDFFKIVAVKLVVVEQTNRPIRLHVFTFISVEPISTCC